jgi:predicted phosphodiesterase
MRIVAISDTHGKHNELDVPDGDILIHCGDFTMKGLMSETNDFIDWFEKQPHPNKILICGNHERGMDPRWNYYPGGKPRMVKQLQMKIKENPNFHYLENSSVVITLKNANPSITYLVIFILVMVNILIRIPIIRIAHYWTKNIMLKIFQ